MRRMTAVAHCATPRLLVIDDDPSIHALVRAHLLPQRVDFIDAIDGRSGIDAALKKHPDAILLDLDMPKMHGFEVCRALRADRRTRHIPIVILTSAADPASKIRGLECGALDYLVKPFQPAELRARLANAFGLKRMSDQTQRDSIRDELTGLSSRRYFDARLEADLAIARRLGRPLGCLFLDIDHMAAINAEHGIEVGDHLIRQAANTLTRCCRKEDTVCRFGDDEFAALVGGASCEMMHRLAARIRKRVEDAAAAIPNRIVRITVSIGFAVSRFSMGTSLVAEAIDALRHAQACGGDCIRDGKELLELRLVG
jgi:diguanylate cyclase (GGDEF)-like protein